MVIKMIEEIIEKVFHTKTYKIEKLQKGLTNDNYLVHIEKEAYILRIPPKDNAHIINHLHEKIVHDLVKELDVDCIYFDPHTGIKITRYLNHLYEYDECPYADKIERCAKLMKRLHQIPAVPFHFEPLKTLNNYKHHVSKPLYDLSKYDFALKEIQTFNNQEVLCHNDFVSGNILYGEDKDYLIDYEYGASNDPLFDVTSFLSENKIFDETLRDRFYCEYFEDTNQIPKEQLYIWEVFQNVLWCYWAMMMYESRHENIYQNIASDKYEALLKMEFQQKSRY